MRLTWGLGWVGLSCALLSAGASCDDSSVETADDLGGTGGKDGGVGGSGGTAGDAASDAPLDGQPPPGGGVGDACSASEPCRPGLACTNGVCELGHSSEQGASCVVSGECKDGLQCVAGKCAPAGLGDAGAACTSDMDCKSGLRCVLAGFAAECAPEGKGDFGDACAVAGDCYGGLTCLQSKCVIPPPGVPTFGAPSWPGVQCDAPSATDVRAYFEVPGATSPKGDDGDFFRFPFPSDVRKKSGKLDLTGFPVPGPGVIGFDPVKLYVDALSNESDWGTYATTIFRFSGAVDFNSLKTEVGGKYPVQWVDVTEGTPEFGSSVGLYFMLGEGKTKYVCDNWLAIRRPQGRPMKPGHKYAVWLTSAAKAKDGISPVQPSPHLQSMLSDVVPSDPALAAAHAVFAPFRAYLKAKVIQPNEVLNATVITAGSVQSSMKALATAALAAPMPTAKSWVKCASGVASPCPQAQAERACGDGSSPDYDEYHALVSLPIFQKGTPPYLTAGGDVRTDAPERTEEVCMALTVPKGTMPASGWPLVVYAHGTGGSFRSHVRPEVAGALAKAVTPSGTVPFAVLGIDQVQHGPRRGTSTASPNGLFFNFGNPAAARGNPQQGAADQLSVARWAAALNVDAATSGGAAIKVDPARIVFYGHSQGATHGSLGLPFTDGYRAAVLSGNGASLLHALLEKTQPVNIAGALPLALQDADGLGKLPGGDMHPVLSLLQTWIDPADPLNFARSLAVAPETGKTPKHLFAPYGLGDHYSPPSTLATFAVAAALQQGTADSSAATPDDLGLELPVKALPLTGNVTVGTAKVTLGMRQYGPPSGKDGHFVALDVASARNDLARFLGMAASGAVPQIGP